MAVTIKSWDGRVLYVAENTADVREAVKAAVKSGANLSRANLSGANLSGANLYRADLSRANLSGANLYGAKGIQPSLVNDLLILLDQPGKIRAYKLVTPDGYGPIKGGLRYEVGKTVEVENANTDSTVECGAGINVATLPWCLRSWRSGYRILIVEFTKKDIAAIPVGDGKFRVSKCKVVKEYEFDPVELGLAKEG